MKSARDRRVQVYYPCPSDFARDGRVQVHFPGPGDFPRDGRVQVHSPCPGDFEQPREPPAEEAVHCMAFSF